MNKMQLGSLTAKNGFRNERDIKRKFEAWENDLEAQQWLIIMGYKLEDIEFVKAIVISGQKADINLQIMIKLRQAIDIENLQVKLVSNATGFNQIDKRWIESYVKLWNIPSEVAVLLKHFTGELPPRLLTQKIAVECLLRNLQS